MKKLIIASVAGLAAGVGTHMLTYTDLMYARGMAVIGGEIFFDIANGLCAFWLALKIQEAYERLEEAYRDKHYAELKR